MATKPKPSKTTPAMQPATAEDLARQAKDKADEDVLTARVMTNGQCNTIVVQRYLHCVDGSSNLQALSEVSMEQARAIGDGDFRVLEHMLWSQATALQAMFVDLAVRAKRQDRFDAIQTMTTLALKAAAQSRQAVVALAELRMPKTVMFAKQANFAQQQQVNNGAAAGVPNGGRAHAEEITSSQNELLEQQHGVELDTRAQSTAGGADPHLAAVGAIHRAEVTHR